MGPFQFDDYGVIVNYSGVHSFSEWWHSFGHGLRPLLKLSYTFNWVTGLGPVGFHLFNLAIHIANTLFVGLIYKAAQRSETFSTGALLAMTLFALHPIQTEAVTYICGRSASLMTFWYALSLLVYVHGGRKLISPLLFLASALTKEAALTLPMALVLWELCIEKNTVRVAFQRTAVFWGLFLILGIAAILHPGYFSLLYDMTGVRPLDQALFYQIDGVTYLLTRLIAIRKLSVLPGLGVQPPHAWLVFLDAALFLIVIVWAHRQRHRNALLLFGVSWFFLHMFIPYIFLPRVDVLNEHHMYLANVGLLIAIGAFVEYRLAATKRIQHALLPLTSILIALLMIHTVVRNFDYRSHLAFWENTVQISPPNPHAYNNLGVAYQDAGRIREARDYFNRALILAPGFENPRQNLERLEKHQTMETAQEF